MENTLPHTLRFLESSDIARVEAVSKQWLNIIGRTFAWKLLCTRYFAVQPETRKWLKDTENPKLCNLGAIPVNRPALKRGLDLYDYYDYFVNTTIPLWKRLFLFFAFLYSEPPVKLDKARAMATPVFQYEGLALNFIRIFTEDCKSTELTSILEQYVISQINFYSHIRPKYELLKYFHSEALAYLVSERLKKGNHITKTSTDVFSIFVQRVMQSMENSARVLISTATIDGMDESYALEFYTELYHANLSSHNKYAATDWFEVVCKMLAYLGSPLAINVSIKNFFNIFHDVALFDNEHEAAKSLIPTMNSATPRHEISKQPELYFMHKKLGVTTMAAHLLKKDSTSHTTTDEVIQDLEAILESGNTVFVKQWAVYVLVASEPIYEYWRSSCSAMGQVTKLLVKALTMRGQPWHVVRLAQRLLVGLGKRKEIDVQFVVASLNTIVRGMDISTQPLKTQVSLDAEGEVFCWALLVLLQLQPTQEIAELGQSVFISIPNLSEVVRTDILKYFGPAFGPNTHQRWLIELALKGVEYRDTLRAHWAYSFNKPIITPQEIASKLLQQQIIADVGTMITHKGFRHCGLANGVAIGTYYEWLIALSKDKEVIELRMSEIGPYVYLRTYKSDWPISPDITEQQPHEISANDILTILYKVLKRNGVRILPDKELSIDLGHYEFVTDLGDGGNLFPSELTVGELLYSLST